ncbi:titin-like protein [Lates japonicus]|uniref:Titin-like protein n=1 Tax=Lates japonicus TaxID=270547 RepID=A0AAD3NAJ3_LATJO|nr:titin-like protein [Lates japonicus]
MTADCHKALDLAVTEGSIAASGEPRPRTSSTVSSQPMQLPEETPFIADVKQRRLVPKLSSLNVSVNSEMPFSLRPVISQCYLPML